MTLPQWVPWLALVGFSLSSLWALVTDLKRKREEEWQHLLSTRFTEACNDDGE